MKFDFMLKQYILSRYGTLKDFATACGMSYNTMDSIFRRGTEKTSIANFLTICRTLGISADDIVEGRIVLTSTKKPPTEVETLLLVSETPTIDGLPLAYDEYQILTDCIETACKIIRRGREQ